jgi:DNA (cytosine-5)-methyltransferase 1
VKIAKARQATLFDDLPPRAVGAFADFCNSLGVSDGPNWADRFGIALRQWASKAIKRPIRTLSLFSGVGGLDIAFHDAGFAISHAVEIDERFAATLSANSVAGGYIDGCEVVCRDIREFHPHSDLATDFIIGGPPCQSFSAAGRRAAGVMGTQDDRGVLFREYVRLLNTLKPAGFLFENVYGITGAEGGKAWESIQREFTAAGYTIASRILDTADFGVPQHRERIFILGMKTGRFQFPRPTHGPDSPDGRKAVSASEAIAGIEASDREKDASLGGRFGHLLAEIPPGLNYSFFTEEMKHPKPIFAWRSKFSDFLYKADPETPIRTLKAQGGQYTGPFHWDNRPFGLSELKRLQTIPDAYQIVGKRQVAMHQIGNSVPPQVGRILAISVLSQVFGIELPSKLPTLDEHEQLGFRTRKRGLTAIYRAKARIAIGKTEVAEKTSESKRSYRARLSEDFAWQVHAQDSNLQIECNIGEKQWVIAAAPSGMKCKRTPSFEIEVSGNPSNPWSIGETKVCLKGYAATRDVFFGAWKAFETELIRLGLKADLVQLCEYYQYTPRFLSRMTLVDVPDQSWETLAKVVEGVGTRKILKSHELASEWDVQSDELLPLAMWLRSFGYEARNKLTNAQIPLGSYLIPYSFPTLTPQSVQLRKRMAVEVGQ